MKKINLNIKIVLLFAVVSLLASCNDCPLEQQDPIFLCQTRIVTMEEFNPNFTVTPGPIQGEEIVTLDARYNISIFEFPQNLASTGSFPNDNRFKGTSQIPIAEVPFAVDNTLYYAAYVDTYPLNSDLAGDILLRQVNLALPNNTALLRLAGSIALIDRNFFNEDAQAFCDYVSANTNMISTAYQNFTTGNKYGANQLGAQVTQFDTNPIVISDQTGKIIGTLGGVGVPQPPQSILDLLNVSIAQKTAIDLLVEPGNVYAYIAKNGKRFVFFVSEIRETPVLPNRRRVTIMMYPLDK